MNSIQVSLFEGKPTIFQTHPASVATLEEVYRKIQADAELQHSTIELRSENQADYVRRSTYAQANSSVYEYRKLCLQAFTAAGVFDKRMNSAISKASFHMAVDFNPEDNPGLEDQIEQVKKKLSELAHIVLLYTTASGKGLKAIIKLAAKSYTSYKELEQYYAKAYTYLSREFVKAYGLKVYKEAQALCALSFLCHDPQVYYNPAAQSLEIKDIKTVKPKNLAAVGLVESITRFMEEQQENIFTDEQDFDFITALLYSLFDEKTARDYLLRLYSIAHLVTDEGMEMPIKAALEKKVCVSIKLLVKKALDLGYRLDEKQDYKRYAYHYTDLLEIFSYERYVAHKNVVTKKQYMLVDGRRVEYTDALVNKTMNLIREKYIPALRKEHFTEYFHDERNIREFHPFSELFETIKTADDSEFNRFLSCIKTTNDGLTRKMFLRWCVDVCINLFSGKNYGEHIMIFKGEQAVGKTTMVRDRFCSIFAEYINENFSWQAAERGSKEELVKLVIFAIIFDDELTASSRADIESIKKISSIKEVHYRQPYAKYTDSFKRNASFIGCTNNNEIFNDLTGDRRFLIVEIRLIIRAILNSINFQKVWGYIYYVYLEEIDVFIDLKELSAHNSQYRLITDDEALLREYVEPSTDTQDYLTTVQIKDFFVKNRTPLKSNSDRVGSLLIKIGIKRRRLSKEPRLWVYQCRINDKGIAVNSLIYEEEQQKKKDRDLFPDSDMDMDIITF